MTFPFQFHAIPIPFRHDISIIQVKFRTQPDLMIRPGRAFFHDGVILWIGSWIGSRILDPEVA